MTIPGLVIIGDRIDPGFRSTRDMIDADDLDAIQALAVRQRDSGAGYLDVTIGARAREDSGFLVAVIEAVQAVVDLPLCFDDPSFAVHELCLNTYDQDKAGGKKPLINSIAETRWELLDLAAIRPVKFIMMSSERIEDGVGKQNKTAEEKLTTVKRMTAKMVGADYGLSIDDLIVDIAISTLASDTESLTRHCLDTVRAIGCDPELKGIHMSCGLTNLSTQLPSVEVEGKPLKLQLENAFLTLAVPAGFDMVLATPWRNFELLPENDPVLLAFKEIIALEGLDALRRLRKLYRR